MMDSPSVDVLEQLLNFFAVAEEAFPSMYCWMHKSFFTQVVHIC